MKNVCVVFIQMSLYVIRISVFKIIKSTKHITDIKKNRFYFTEYCYKQFFFHSSKFSVRLQISNCSLADRFNLFINHPKFPENANKNKSHQTSPKPARHGRLHHTRTDPHIFPKPSAIIFRRASIPSGFENIRV